MNFWSRSRIHSVTGGSRLHVTDHRAWLRTNSVYHRGGPMESSTLKANFFSWSAIVRYAVISAINLAILITGIMLGIMMAPHLEKSASAREPQATAPQTAPANPTAGVPAQQDQYEEVT